MFKNIIIILLSAVCVILGFWGLGKGSDEYRISDLECTISEYRESNEAFKNENNQLESTIAELRTDRDRLITENNKLRETINEISRIIEGADADILAAKKTIERLKKLSDQIRN